MVIVVPLSKRVGLGSVIGYLIAGALIGPYGLSLLHNTQGNASEVAEFGAAFANPDQAEGMNAFIEKRKPVFV